MTTKTKEPVIVLKKDEAPDWRKAIRKEQLYVRLGLKPSK